MLEKKIERTVCAYAKQFGFHSVKFKDPARAGAPDRIFFAPFGVTFFIEFKREGEKPRKNQIEYHKRLIKLGQPVDVVDSIEAGKKIIQRMSLIINDHKNKN